MRYFRTVAKELGLLNADEVCDLEVWRFIQKAQGKEITV